MKEVFELIPMMFLSSQDQESQPLYTSDEAHLAGTYMGSADSKARGVRISRDFSLTRAVRTQKPEAFGYLETSRIQSESED
ncbi:hypothetical protein FP744_10009615 [Trichoderma asperellum]